MRSRFKFARIASVAVVAAGTAGAVSGCEASDSVAGLRSAGPDRLARVAAVLDGDAIKVWQRGVRRTVRLIGIDASESQRPGVAIECGALEATSSMYELVYTHPVDSDGDELFDGPGGRGRSLRLRGDRTQDRIDRYGRLLPTWTCRAAEVCKSISCVGVGGRVRVSGAAVSALSLVPACRP